MENNFDRAVDWLIDWETAGGKKMRVLDKDGRTLCGVCAKFFPEWVNTWWNKPDAEIVAAAKKFYFDNFWVPTGCEVAAEKFDVFSFDCSVNQGVALGKQIAICNSGWAAFALRVEAYVTAEEKRKNNELPGWLNRIVAVWRELL